MLLLLGFPQHGGAHGGHQGEGDHQAGQQGISDGQSHVGEKLSGDALSEHDGQKYADGGQGGGENGSRHLGGSLDSGLCRRYPLVSQPVDILDDHDAVIHQHTDPQGEAGQGDDV